MKNAAQYFELARYEETNGNDSASLLLYLSSFCDSFNSDRESYHIGSISKIRQLQTRLSLSDSQLLSMIHSYGPLSDAECQQLLTFSIQGDISSIKNTLSNTAR